MSGEPLFDDIFRNQMELLLHWRRDVRHFRRDALPDGAIANLIRLASLAPSVGNAQPAHFIRILSADLRHELVDHIDAAAARAGDRYESGVQKHLYGSLKLHGLREAPEVIAVFSDEAPEAGHGLGIATMPEVLRYSTVMAIHTLWLAARAQGIGMGWVSILDPLQVKEMLSAPTHWRLIALLCIGYPQQPSEEPELQRAGWQDRLDWRLSLIER
jgi:5,6-dimethylbenzimidazole synthase